ncbi:MAG: hypothetical protein WKF52_07215 [Sphingomicrobium sp.]
MPVIRPSTSTEANPDRGWWEHPGVLLALVALSAVPLLYPKIPPLVDLLGHMGRYRVQLNIDNSPFLQQYYTYRWAAIGNLGVDLLIVPLRHLVGLEAGLKVIVVAIPPLTVAGFLWVAREVHGRIPPTTLFALPFALGFPFLFGFVNFALSMALAFLAFALWLRLGRIGRTGVRALLFVPISILIFFTHTYGWGALGLLCFSAEAVRMHDRGRPWLRAGIEAAVHAAVMALPLLIMVGWRTETHGTFTAGWFNWAYKWEWVYSALRDRWRLFDLASLIAAGLVVVLAVAIRKLEFSRNLAFSALVLLAAFLLLPRLIFGSAYADMRLVPYLMAVALIAIRYRGDWKGTTATAFAIGGLLFVGVRIGATTASLAIAADNQQARLAAIASIPHGARVATLVGRPCPDSWALPRNTHLGAMVIVRRHGFSNDQWVIEGANLLGLNYRGAGAFSADPSQMVQPNACSQREFWPIDHSLRRLPQGAFDYLWLVDAPPFDQRLTQSMQMVWRGEGSILYRLPR